MAIQIRSDPRPTDHPTTADVSVSAERRGALQDTGLAARWRALRYFSMARVVVAALLLAYVPALHGMRAGLSGFDGPRFMVVAGAYLAVAALFVVLSRPGRLPLQRLVDWQLAADVLALTMLLDAGGPLRAGLAMLLLLPNAGAAILLDARRALFFASMSTFALLVVTGWHWSRGDADDASMAQAGMMGAALMACVLLLNWLATRLDRQERLAAQRGEDVRNQLAVTQAVISELPDGVVVLGATGGVRAINRSAREMLGRRAAAPDDATTGIALLRQALATAAPGALSAQGIELTVPGGVGVTARRLRARRLPGSDEHTDAVIVLEDLGRLEQRAQELKLASMGRMSASIAHEIRNPLAAIRHANGLLAEEIEEPRTRRLSAIVEDNCLRLDRIIEDVLSISRRGAAEPQRIDASRFLREVLDELNAQSGVDASRIVCRIECEQPIWFDAGHLRQVLLNLVGNALRHAGPQAGSVCVSWIQQGDRPALEVSDTGAGVAPESRAHLFEPFFTTQAKGTGLGLHLARELCSANGATIRYRPPGESPGASSAFIVEPAAIPTAP